MRGFGLMLLGCCAFACAAPPSAEPDVVEVEVEVEQPSEPEPRDEAEGEEVDPVLARVRGRVRSGRVPESLRRELLESDQPDHRHAARLLQAIEGEPPASVLARAAAVAVEVASAEELFEPEPELEPAAELVEPSGEIEIEIEIEVEPEPESEDDLDERPPKLSSFPIGSPAWQWFASGLTVIEAPDEPIVVEPWIETHTLVGPLPLLLRERPPVPEAPAADPGEGPRLVILTSLALRPGSSSELTALDLAGAGLVRLDAQPLTSRSVRLTAIDAGAVPTFLAARPSAPGLEVVDVARRDRRLEIEVELGPGWYLRAVTSLGNGASVQFERLE
jgi:hypothetical protein